MPDPQQTAGAAGAAYAWHPHFPGIVARDDHQLRVSAWNAAAGVTLTIAGAMGRADGCVVPFVYTHIPNVDRSRSQQIFVLEAGVLLWCEVFGSAGAPIANQCYVRLELIQGREGATQSLATVLAGYVTANSPRTYPNDVVRRSVDERGTFRIVLGTAPGAGAEILETVPANTRWSLQAFRFKLTASGVAGNRTPILTIDDGVNIVWESGNNTAVTTGQVAIFNAGAGVQQSTIATLDVQIALPEPLVLPAGARIRTVTGGILAGDQYAAPVYNVEEWLDV